MSIKTQGSKLYTIDPDTGAVLVVGCVTNIDGIDSAIEQIEDTCLESPDRTYKAGLGTPGTATFAINFDPADASHVRLYELKQAGTSLPWALGWSDGIGVDPTADSNGEFVLPATRSWLTWNGFMNSFPFTFALNAVVASTVGIQISGAQTLTPKTP